MPRPADGLPLRRAQADGDPFPRQGRAVREGGRPRKVRSYLFLKLQVRPDFFEFLFVQLTNVSRAVLKINNILCKISGNHLLRTQEILSFSVQLAEIPGNNHQTW